MAFVRIVLLALLLASGVFFALYIFSGQQRHKQRGLQILKWTLVAAFGFFAILISDRLAG